MCSDDEFDMIDLCKVSQKYGTLYATFELSSRSTKFGDSIEKISTNLLTMIRDPGYFERPQLVGAPNFSYGNIYHVAYHETRVSKTNILNPKQASLLSSHKMVASLIVFLF